MNLPQYLATLPHGGRKALAERLGISPSYLSQLASGVRPCSIPMAALLERESEGVCRAEEVLPAVDWDLIRGRPTREEAA